MLETTTPSTKRLYLVSLIIIVCGTFTFLALDRAVTDLDWQGFALTLGALFLFTIFNSIFLMGGSFRQVFLVHLIVGLILAAAIVSQAGLYLALLLLVVYVALQSYAFYLVYYFEQERLRVNWIPVFKATWYGLSWFCIFTIALTLILRVNLGAYRGAFLESFFQRLEPVLTSLNLPSPNTTISKAIEQSVVAPAIPEAATAKQRFQFKQLINTSSQQLVQLGLKQFNEQFDLELKGRETVGEAITLALEKFWLKLSERTRVTIKILFVSLVAMTIQPFFWLLGNILSLIALPFFGLAEKLRLFGKSVQTVEKETIVI